ncbi:hypothetical protein [Mesorhizobium marinum]|uniref:Uncharacterized protein n=1 Tax=Mesorhizobium marinum TaxID=3228790 RepID=A0ABV3R4R6_9HYPH
MIASPLLALGIVLLAAGPTRAFELPPAIAELTAAEYNELSMFVRAEVMEPIAEAANISYSSLNACLKTAAVYPEYRNWKIPRAAAGCIQLLRKKDE